MPTDQNSKLAMIDRLYDEGASTDKIVRLVGHDPATLRLIGSRLGLSTRPGTQLDYARRRAEGENV